MMPTRYNVHPQSLEMIPAEEGLYMKAFEVFEFLKEHGWTYEQADPATGKDAAWVGPVTVVQKPPAAPVDDQP